MKGRKTEMAASLLAHLYSHIKGSQEDVATLSLQYIVSRSAALNREFTGLLCRALHGNVGTELNYVCQAVGENLERPDIAGIDPNGKEQILCEAKFYAGLTDNQPNGYLDRLKKNEAYGLVFICPAARKVTLWSKLLELCRERNVVDLDKYCVAVDGVRMSILTWGEIVQRLHDVASSEATDLRSDIDQLDGFCKLMDSEAFIPFSTEDFGPENAIREERLYQTLDAVFSRLMTDKQLHCDAKGLKATAYRNGYVRYIRAMDLCLAVSYDRRLWGDSATEDTPFWVVISDSEWKQPERFQRAFARIQESQKENLDGKIALALKPRANAVLDEVAEDIVNQIRQYINTIEEPAK